MSTFGPRLGYLQQLYVAGNLVTNVKKLKRNDNRGPLENTTRACGGFKQYANGLRDFSITFSMNYDATDTNGFVALQTAYQAGTAPEINVLDEEGKGVSAEMIVTKFDGVEENDQIVEVEVEMKPFFGAADPPEQI